MLPMNGTVGHANGTSASQTTIGGACQVYLQRLGTRKSASAVVLMEELQRLADRREDRRKAYRLVSATLGRTSGSPRSGRCVAPGATEGLFVRHEHGGGHEATH